MEPKAHARPTANAVAVSTAGLPARRRKEEEEEEEEEEDGLSENIFFGSCGFQTRKKVSSCAYSGLTTGTRVTRARFTSHTPQAELLLDGLQEPLRVVHTVDPRDADQCIEKRMLSIHTKIGVIENAALRLPPAEVCSGGWLQVKK